MAMPKPGTIQGYCGNFPTLNRRTVLSPHVVGVKPEAVEPRPSYPIQHCPLCGAPTIIAWDGECADGELTPLHARACDFDPLPDENRWRGDVVLWFVVGHDDKPTDGRQRFTRLAQINGDYFGPLWQYHRTTCGKRQQTLPGVA